MAGTKAGAMKRRETMIEKHGGLEGYLAYQRGIASEAGKVSNPNKGFGYDDRTVLERILKKRKLASIAGQKGGSVSRRSK